MKRQIFINCLECDQKILRIKKDQKFCSTQCRNDWHNRERYNTTCPNCGHHYNTQEEKDKCLP